MDISINIHLDKSSEVTGSVATVAGSVGTYGVLKFKEGYPGCTVFLGDDATQTRDAVRAIRKALADIVRNIPKG